MRASGDDGGGGGDASPMGHLKKNKRNASSKERSTWVMPEGIACVRGITLDVFWTYPRRTCMSKRK